MARPWSSPRRATAVLAVLAVSLSAGVAVAGPAAGVLHRGPLERSLADALLPMPPGGPTSVQRLEGSLAHHPAQPQPQAQPWQERLPAWRRAADDASSLLVVVNKQRPLQPADYVPQTLRPVDGVLLRAEAADALGDLLAAASADGVPLRAQSGYRSYADQRVTYRRWERELGPQRADVQSARAGFSEHQTGLAVDMLPAGGSCQEYGCFAGTPQARWLAQHAGRFGFVVRYQAGQQPRTGYTGEPWHLRYLGVQAAADVAASGARSLEEHLGLPPAPGY